jgi:transposase
MSDRALGWDIHRKFSMVSVRELTADGELRVVERRRLEHDDPEAMRRWLTGQPAGTPVAMEAAFGWPWIADLLEGIGLDPHLAHPPAVRVLAKHQAKTDRCDADRLGEFYLQGILPESYLAPPPVRQLRERIRYRMALSAVRQGVKNRVHAILHCHGILHPFSDLFGQQGRVFLDELSLPEASRSVLDGYLRLLGQLDALVGEVEHWMEANLPADEIVTLLATLPGIGKILSHVLKAEIGQIERFPSFRHLASYAGLAPISDDSALRHGRRHTSEACNHTLRWAMIEAAHVVASRCQKQAPRLVALHQRLSCRGSKNSAKVAVARELIKLVHAVWTKRKPYTHNPPARPGSLPKKKQHQEKQQVARSVRVSQPR